MCDFLEKKTEEIFKSIEKTAHVLQIERKSKGFKIENYK